MSDSSRTSASGARLRFFLGAGILVAAFLIFNLTPLRQYLDRETLRALFERIDNSPWSPYVFVGAFSLGLTLAMPASAFIVTAGVVFGPTRGFLYSWIGCVLGSSCAFFFARLLGRDLVQRLLPPRVSRMDRALELNSFWAQISLRLIPIFPFNFSNFMLGVSRVPYPAFVAATAVGMIPGLGIATYFADALWRSDGSSETLWRLVGAGVLMLIAAGGPWWLHRREARRLAGITPWLATSGSDPTAPRPPANPPPDLDP